MPTKTIRVETVGQAYLEILRERGIEYFFGTAGSDFASIVDGFAKFAAEGKTTPRPMVVSHEFVAVSLAHGYYAVTGRPQITMVHQTVGTANAIGAIINAARTQTPIILTAGRTPITENEGLRGMRDLHIHWAQEAFDQAGMLREFVKWDYELRQAVQIETVVDRALELAMAEPRGPVYLTLPREVLAQPLEEITIRTSARHRTPSRRFPDPAQIDEAARILATAQRPLIITAAAGRVAAAVPLLLELAESGGIGVLETAPECMNFPANSYCHIGYTEITETHAAIMDADAILVVDCDVPWSPARGKPRDDAQVIQLGVDPLFSRYPIRSFPCDVAIAAEPLVALPLLTSALRRSIGKREVDARRKRLEAGHRETRAAWGVRAQAERGRTPIGFEWASRCLGDIYGPETIIVNEYPLDLRHASPTVPGSYFGEPHAGALGWGFGAALGVKLAAPDKTVVATLGDGSYLFAVPSACHHASQMHGLPILVVIFNNGSWDAVKQSTLDVHPNGWAASTGTFPLSDLKPSPHFEEIARAFGGYGERVEAPEKLPGALERALRIVQEEQRQVTLNVVCRR